MALGLHWQLTVSGMKFPPFLHSHLRPTLPGTPLGRVFLLSKQPKPAAAGVSGGRSHGLTTPPRMTKMRLQRSSRAGRSGPPGERVTSSILHYPEVTRPVFLGRRSQVLRQETANLRSVRSIPPAASTFQCSCRPSGSLPLQHETKKGAVIPWMRLPQIAVQDRIFYSLI